MLRSLPAHTLEGGRVAHETISQGESQQREGATDPKGTAPCDALGSAEELRCEYDEGGEDGANAEEHEDERETHARLARPRVLCRVCCG